MEFKGVGSSINIDSYYKTIGYAGILISHINKKNKNEKISALDVNITLLSFYYPRNLIKHLTKERKLTVEKSSPGIHYINTEIIFIQIIVTKEVSGEENLYFRCMTNRLQDADLIRRLVDDCEKHKDQEIYMKYLHQITRANKTMKGEFSMVCEGLFELYGTTSQEFYDRGRQDAKQEYENYYLPKIDELKSTNEQLSSSNKQQASQNAYLK